MFKYIVNIIGEFKNIYISILVRYNVYINTCGVYMLYGKESADLPYLYWIPKLHKTQYKDRYIAGSSTCSTKELSIHLTKILSAVKEGQ